MINYRAYCRYSNFICEEAVNEEQLKIIVEVCQGRVHDATLIIHAHDYEQSMQIVFI